jgi:clan AA aspartic protease (TIGR02281 family)
MRRSSQISGVLLVIALLHASRLSADIFRWVDDQGIVHFADNLQNVPESYRSKVTRTKTEPLPPAPIPAPPEKSSISFQKKGELMTVQATLNERAAATLVVDTGASYTVISQATARELEIDLEKNHPTLPFQTANGIIQAPLVSIQSIEIGGMLLRDVKVAVHDIFPDAGIAGLLGLNFLGQFRFDIDNKNGVMHLEKK